MNSSERAEMISPNRIKFTFAFFIYILMILIPFLSAIWLIDHKLDDTTIFRLFPLAVFVLSLIAYPYYVVSKDGEKICGATLWGWRWRREQIQLSDVHIEKVLHQSLGSQLGIVILYSKLGAKILTLGLSASQISRILESVEKQQTNQISVG